MNLAQTDKSFRRVGLLPSPFSHIRGDTLTVILGEFSFENSHNYYFRVTGPTPLAVAQELYRTEVGKTDIRASGDGGCGLPVTWAEEVNGKFYVMSYHIDSELGLYLFLEALKKHNLTNTWENKDKLNFLRGTILRDMNSLKKEMDRNPDCSPAWSALLKDHQERLAIVEAKMIKEHGWQKTGA